MAIRKRTLFTLTAVTLSYIGLLSLAVGVLAFRGLDDLERTAVEEAASRFRTEIGDVIHHLSSVTHDWGIGDDIVAFLQGRNPDFARLNVEYATLQNLDLNLMAYLNMRGEPVFTKWTSLGTDLEPGTRSEDILAAYRSGGGGTERSGILSVGSEFFYVATHPIQNVQQSAPPQGIVLVARHIDPREFDRISAKINAKASFALSGSESAEAYASLRFDTSHARSIAGTISLPNPWGRPAVLGRVELPRTIFQQGREVLTYSLLLLVISGVLFAAIVNWLVEKAVLRRLSLIDAEIETLGKGADYLADTGADSDDEISHLTRKMNELIDSERATAKDLAQSRTLFQGLFEKTDESIFILQADGPDAGKIVAANPGAAKAHGYTDEEIRRLRIGDIDAPGTEEISRSLMERIYAGEWVRSEMAHRRKDGSTFPVEVSAGLLDMRGSRFILGLDRDITERKRFEAELRQERERAEESNRLKSEFLSNVTHELRTPLNSIIGYAELLKDGVDGPLNERQQESLTRVMRNARVLLHHIEEILDFARIESERLVLDDHAFSLRETIGETVRMLRVVADKKKLELRWEVDPELPDLRMGDEKRLRQILINLLDNAVKFTETGFVAIGAHPDREDPLGERVLVEVTDTGIGIAPEIAPHIFEAFVQGDGSTSRRYGGSGLGLAIASRLVEKMEGTIEFTPNAGGGSVFRFSVRLKRALEG